MVLIQSHLKAFAWLPYGIMAASKVIHLADAKLLLRSHKSIHLLHDSQIYECIRLCEESQMVFNLDGLPYKTIKSLAKKAPFDASSVLCSRIAGNPHKCLLSKSVREFERRNEENKTFAEPHESKKVADSHLFHVLSGRFSDRKVDLVSLEASGEPTPRIVLCTRVEFPYKSTLDNFTDLEYVSACNTCMVFEAIRFE